MLSITFNMIVLFIKSAVLKRSIKFEFKVKVMVTVNPTFSICSIRLVQHLMKD